MIQSRRGASLKLAAYVGTKRQSFGSSYGFAGGLLGIIRKLSAHTGLLPLPDAVADCPVDELSQCFTMKWIIFWIWIANSILSGALRLCKSLSHLCHQRISRKAD